MATQLKIGQLARQAGCSVKAVRFYETKGLLPAPPRSPAGYRIYTDDHVRCLALIRRAKSLGLSLAKIRTLVVHVAHDPRPGARLRPQLARLIRNELKEIETKLDELATRRRTLESLLTQIHDGNGGFPRELCACATGPRRSRS